MTLRKLTIGAALSACGASAAWAQPVGVYASGMLHQPVGEVLTTSVNERRLTACCIGSSGQDGVDVQLHSLSGGGVGVDVSPLTTPGQEIRIRPRGWDGTIKGRIEISAGVGGGIMTTVDFSAIGATALRTIEYGPDGQVISDVTTPGSIQGYLDNPVCPPPMVPTVWYTSGGWVVWGCGVGLDPYGDPYPYPRLVAPVGGTTPVDFGGVETIEIRARNFPELVVMDASMGTFGRECWGAGQAHLQEQCDSGACAASDVHLVATNIGSSGQDGVAFDLGAIRPPAGGGLPGGGGSGGTGGFTFKSKRCPECPPGHVILMKAFDDEGQEMRMTHTLLDPLTGDTAIEADFSAIGAIGYVVTYYGPGGVVVGPPGGTAHINGGPRPVWHADCPPGSRAIFINVGTTSNPVWQFQGCEGIFELTVPGVGTIGGVAMIELSALNPTSSYGRMRQCYVTGTETSAITVEELHVTELRRADTDCSGVVDFFDIDPFLQAMFNPREYTVTKVACPLSNADCNNDGTVDFFDIDPFIQCLFGGCP